MREVLQMLGQNGLWVMIIAVVGIGGWFKFREKEMQAPQEAHRRELEHPHEDGGT